MSTISGQDELKEFSQQLVALAHQGGLGNGLDSMRQYFVASSTGVLLSEVGMSELGGIAQEVDRLVWRSVWRQGTRFGIAEGSEPR